MRVVRTASQVSSFMGLPASEEGSGNSYDHHRVGRGGWGSTEQEPTTFDVRGK